MEKGISIFTNLWILLFWSRQQPRDKQFLEYFKWKSNLVALVLGKGCVRRQHGNYALAAGLIGFSVILYSFMWL